MTHQFFLDKRPHDGLTYKQYSDAIIKDLLLLESAGTDTEQINLIKLNIQRSSRIDRTYNASPEIKEQISAVSEPQLWLIISEPWCGDSAQNIPHLAAMAAINPLIDLRILKRDENPDIMDLYLSGGTRSIPKLIAFDIEGNELFQWGPRPKEGADLVKNLKAAGMEKKEFLEKLHLWYGRNRGKALEQEILEVLININSEELTTE